MVEKRKVESDHVESIRQKYKAIAERDDKKEGEPKNSGGSLGVFFLASHNLAVNGIHGCVVSRSAIRRNIS